MTASPTDAGAWLPSEETIARLICVDNPDDCMHGSGGTNHPMVCYRRRWEESLPAARAILALIRPAFEAKEREIERIKSEVELTFMSLIFVPAIRAAIEALPEDDDLQPYRARAEAALSAEAKLAQAVEVAKEYAHNYGQAHEFDDEGRWAEGAANAIAAAILALAEMGEG